VIAVELPHSDEANAAIIPGRRSPDTLAKEAKFCQQFEKLEKKNEGSLQKILDHVLKDVL
jgi:hypothetical protein